MTIASRQELKDYCLRRLGDPVIEINVSDEQVEDRLSDALEMWNEYHFDGVERVYLKQEIIASTLKLVTDVAPGFIPGELITGATSGATASVWGVKANTTDTLDLKRVVGTFVAGEIVTGAQSAISATTAANCLILGNWDTQYFELPDAVLGVAKIFSIGPVNPGFSPRSIFDVVYQFRLTDMYNLLSTDLIYYSQVKQHLQMLEMILPSERSIRFNRKSGRIYIDMNWYEMFTPGYFVVCECFRILNPDDFTKIYNDLFLKRYATALIKRQWGANMSKFEGIQLPGGVTLSGDKMYLQAVEEIGKIEEEMQSRFELPVDFLTG